MDPVRTHYHLVDRIKIPLLVFLLFDLLIPTSISAQFERSASGARSQAMGGAFVSLGDDASALFINNSGLVTISSSVLYGDFTERVDPGEEHESKVGFVFPALDMVFGAGWYRGGLKDARDEHLFVAGIARKLLEGTQGSFLSVGAGIRLGYVSNDSSCPCASNESSTTDVSGDLGIMLRPLPVLSFGYSIENVRKVDFNGSNGGGVQTVRWGLSYFWEEKVIVSYEQEHLHDRTIRHYGFSIRTGVPLELMAGFTEENVTGGARWVSDRVRATVSFRSYGSAGVSTSASLEFSIGRSGGGE